MGHRKGSLLLLVAVICSVWLVLSVILCKIVYNCQVSSACLVQREEAFWLAEAGVAAAKARLHENPNWYTDLPHSPPDDSDWAKAAAAGYTAALGDGYYKIIREKDRDLIYTVGFAGQAVVVVGANLSLFPIKVLSWDEI